MVTTILGLTLALGAGQQPCVVLDAIPNTRVVASGTDAVRSPAADIENRVGILKVGDVYVWATRDGRQLIRRTSGVYDIYIEPGGGGWLKVESDRLPDFLRGDSPFEFIEMASIGMSTITYFGTTTTYDPDCTG